MSYDESDEDGEWEVVDIVHTTTSVKPNKKPKPAKQEDVDRLAQDIQTQLSLKSTHDTQQMLLLEQKLKQMENINTTQLQSIESKLAQLSRIQNDQKHQQHSLDKQRKQLESAQKQQLLEQQIQIQSLSDHQMLTAKQLLEAHQKIQQTQEVTANVNENIQSLQHRQAQQQLQQQLTEQQLQAQLQEQNQLHTQNQLAQLAQIAAQTQHTLPTLPQFPVTVPLGNMANMNMGTVPLVPPVQSQSNGGKNGKNSWLPSFFAFGKNGNGNGNNRVNNSVLDMDMGGSTPPPPIQPVQEEKEPILIEDDDDDVLRWQNDYGNPLYDNPGLLKTKAVIGEGKFAPCEKRQCGWILKNKSNSLLKLNARLECIGGDKQEYGIKVTMEKSYDFQLKVGEEIYILIEVEAPPMIGKYCAFYQFVIDNGVKVGEMLEVMCDVRSEFSQKKEQKIAQIVKMGFADRKQVIKTLQKKKWNVQQSVDTLIGM